MDRKLVAWGLMVKTRSRRRRAGVSIDIPPLWLFTDRRLADPIASVRAMAVVGTPGLFGVVLRGATRSPIAIALAALCRRARIPLLVAGDVRLAHALGAGLHLPSGRRSLVRPPQGRLLSASAHDGAELRSAVRNRADLVFVSPVFSTVSHPEIRPMGRCRAARFAGTASRLTSVFALGGVNGTTARTLSSRFTGAGAISALSE